MVGSHVLSSSTESNDHQTDAEHHQNAFLICADPTTLRYTLVSGQMSEFVASAPITHFYSPIHYGLANPYAIDCHGNFYLMHRAIVMTPPDGVQFDVRPRVFCPLMRLFECVQTFNSLAGVRHDGGMPGRRFPFNVQAFMNRLPPNCKFWSRDQSELSWMQVAQLQDESSREICSLSELVMSRI